MKSIVATGGDLAAIVGSRGEELLPFRFWFPKDLPWPTTHLRFFKKISETTKSIVEDFAFVRDQYLNFKKAREEGWMAFNVTRAGMTQ